MKKFKKILTTLVLVPTLFLPNFAFAQEDTSPAFTEVKVEKSVSNNTENQNTLGKKIEESKEIKSQEKTPKIKSPSFSPWASVDLNDVQFMGIYPASSFFEGKDFRKAITLEDANTAYKLAKEKIESRGLKTGGDFTFKDLTRLETLESISKLLNDDKFAVKNLKESKIFFGQEDEKYLNSKFL